MVWLRPVVFAAVAALCGVAQGASAATLSFSFSFTNTLPNGGGLVTGVVRGLMDDATTAATSVEVLTNAVGFGVGEYVGKPILNSWTVTAGDITGVSFTSFGDLNASPAVINSSLAFVVDGTNTAAGLSSDGNGVSFDSGRGLIFTRLETVSAVPLPLGAWLLLTGLGAFALLPRRRAAA